MRCKLIRLASLAGPFALLPIASDKILVEDASPPTANEFRIAVLVVPVRLPAAIHLLSAAHLTVLSEKLRWDCQTCEQRYRDKNAFHDFIPLINRAYLQISTMGLQDLDRLGSLC